MFKIGYRTLKTALGTAPIYLAQLLHLQNFASAGIITILCIQITQKRSLLVLICRLFIGDRLFICLFGLIGYYPFAIGILLVLFIPTTVVLK